MRRGILLIVYIETSKPLMKCCQFWVIKMEVMSKKTFGGIGAKYANIEDSKILLQSIPYDGTSTWGKGADKGFNAFLDAAVNLEFYDIETDSEVYKQGIHILPEISENASPEIMVKAVYENTK